MVRTLTHAQARRVYDRIGPMQDSQAWYEDRAVGAMLADGDFARARAVIELGCGTGRHAERLLRDALPADARYLGLDVSPRMVGLARARLARYGARARVALTDGAPRVDAPDAGFDRFVSTYVFDLLGDADIRAAVTEARRVLVAGGRLCLVSAAPGRTWRQRAVMGLVSRIHAIHPVLIAGCRPVDLRRFVDGGGWRLERVETVSVLGICSQVVVATRTAGAA